MTKLEEYLQSNPDIVNRLLEANPSLEFLKTWRNPYSKKTPGSLHPTGMEQLYEIAKRLRHGELSSLVDGRGFLPARHRFTSSETPRTIQSAQIWSTGFFYDDSKKEILGEALNLQVAPKKEDWSLRFFEACDKFRNEFESGVYDEERNLLHKTALEREDALVDRLLARLSLQKGDFDKKHVHTMYRTCAYEASLNNDPNGFCSLFTDDDLDTFEYLKDLSIYWARSHGHPFGKHLAAQLLQEIFVTFDGLVSDMAEGEPEVAHFLFGHAETLIPLVSLVGLHDDKVDWRHDSPKEDWLNRSFKSSDICPFAGNFGLLLYRCNGEFFIRALLNEREVVIPGCGDVLCPYSELKTLLSDQLAHESKSNCS